MKPAVFLSYCLGQNEPSRPSSQVVWISNEKEAREALLTELHNECFDTDQDDLTFGFGDTNDQSSYCDLYVSDGDNYVLLTYLTGKRPSPEDTVDDQNRIP